MMLHTKYQGFIKLPFVIKIFISSIFEWPFLACFTVWSQEEVWNYMDPAQTFRLMVPFHFGQV